MGTAGAFKVRDGIQESVCGYRVCRLQKAGRRRRRCVTIEASRRSSKGRSERRVD